MPESTQAIRIKLSPLQAVLRIGVKTVLLFRCKVLLQASILNIKALIFPLISPNLPTRFYSRQALAQNPNQPQGPYR